MKIKWITPSRIIIGSICVAGIVASIMRFTKGLGAVTNLSDKFPWGLWVGFDVLCGVALAAGGFVMTASVYFFNLKRYRPLLRPTILTAFLGYILVSTGLIFDLGKPWNIWHPLIMWNTRSVMFEVAWCVMLYSTVLTLEFSPVIFEHLRMKKAQRLIHAIELPIVAAGVILSTLHQSSLGTVFLIVPGKLHHLWYTPILPILFFISAVTVGMAMIIFESYISSKLFKRGLKFSLLTELGSFLIIALLLYLAIKIQDLFHRGAVGEIFTGSVESFFFIAEILLLAVPMAALMFKRVLLSRFGLFLCSLSVICGVMLNRLNVSIIGMMRSSGVFYFPSIGEITISVFLLTVGVVVFALADKYLPIFPEEDGHRMPAEREPSMKKPIAVVTGMIALLIALPLFAQPKSTAEEKPNSMNVRIKKLSIEDRKSVNPPDFIIYQTQYKKGTQIKFNHRIHARDYGLKCIECHHVEKCAHCHGAETTPIMVEESKIALHETCMACHRAIESGPRKCDECHKQVE